MYQDTLKTKPKVTIPNSELRTLYSSQENRKYQIFIAKPMTDPPSTGWPVIYVLDADSVFGTVVESLRVQSRRPDLTGVFPTLIVGIGYETDAPFHPNRHYDFTLTRSKEELPPHPDDGEWPDQGGANAFLAFIEKDLKPLIEDQYPIDGHQQMLFGHSLGGLFVLHTLFTRPRAFQTYVAGSPSIDWNERLIQSEQNRFIAQLSVEPIHLRLLLSVGEREKNHPSRVNARTWDLYQHLSVLNRQGVQVQFTEFPGEGHVSVLPVLISQAIRFHSSKL